MPLTNFIDKETLKQRKVRRTFSECPKRLEPSDTVAQVRERENDYKEAIILITHIIDHALTTIGCTLDGMETVIEMTTEVETVSGEAAGYLLISCIATIWKECDAIVKETGITH